MLGSFGNTLGNSGMDAFRAHPHPQVVPKKVKKPQQQLNQLVEREWSELPYAMMRITAARRSWEANRVYWRDRNVELGEIGLHLHKARAKGDVAGYTATYSHEELRRDFLMQPSIADSQLYWSAPGISDVQLTTNQLAEKLLNKLMTCYTCGL